MEVFLISVVGAMALVFVIYCFTRASKEDGSRLESKVDNLERDLKNVCVEQINIWNELSKLRDQMPVAKDRDFQILKDNVINSSYRIRRIEEKLDIKLN